MPKVMHCNFLCHVVFCTHTHNAGEKMFAWDFPFCFLAVSPQFSPTFPGRSKLLHILRHMCCRNLVYMPTTWQAAAGKLWKRRWRENVGVVQVSFKLFQHFFFQLRCCVATFKPKRIQMISLAFHRIVSIYVAIFPVAIAFISRLIQTFACSFAAFAFCDFSLCQSLTHTHTLTLLLKVLQLPLVWYWVHFVKSYFATFAIMRSITIL